MSLAKLKNAPFRRGRGNVSEEARQFQDEVLGHLNLLRAATLELSGSTRFGVLNSHSNWSGGSGLRYIPWGNIEEATGGGIDVEVALLPPFGANTVIGTLRVWCEGNAGNTDVTIRTIGGTVLETKNIASMTTGTMHVVTFDYAWEDNAPKLIGFQTSTSPQSLLVQLTVEESA